MQFKMMNELKSAHIRRQTTMYMSSQSMSVNLKSNSFEQKISSPKLRVYLGIFSVVFGGRLIRYNCQDGAPGRSFSGLCNTGHTF